MQNQSGVDDNELNQMIAGLKQKSQDTGVAEPAKETAPANVNNIKPGGIKGLQTMGGEDPASSAKPTDTPPEPITSIKSASQPSQPEKPATPDNGNLANLKKQAINELRPLVGKLNLPPTDKFDTLLLLIRTTDDKTLIPEAYKTAVNIADETRRAQALLDIIKEIDFFSNKK